MASDNAVITIESDHEMDSSEPEPEHEAGPLSPRAIQDQLRLKILESAPTPDEDALFYGDDYEESYMSEDDDGKPSHYAAFPDSTTCSTANETLSKIARPALLTKALAAVS